MTKKVKNAGSEPEHRGSIWSHPYTLYAIGNGIIFILLGVAGWFAWKYGWIPKRG